MNDDDTMKKEQATFIQASLREYAREAGLHGAKFGETLGVPIGSPLRAWLLYEYNKPIHNPHEVHVSSNGKETKISEMPNAHAAYALAKHIECGGNYLSEEARTAMVHRLITCDDEPEEEGRDILLELDSI